jgi:cystathionine gamma-synthase/methionine-gamma-lyase
MKSSQRPDTKAVHAGDRKKPGDYTPVVTPIHLASSFFYDSVETLDQVFGEERPGHNYSRYGNPTTAGLEEQVAALEGADFAIATGSGMAAIHLALMTGITDRRHSIVAGQVLYGQTLSMLMQVFGPLGVESRFADPHDLAGFEEAVAEQKPGCVIVETITNPMLRVCELDKVAEIAHKHGALLIVDATFTPPAMFRAFEHGADLVVHSATKYLGGHGDVLAGIVLGKDELRPVAHFLTKTLGPNLGPFEAYLAMRGVKTLTLRFERQCRNALEVATSLAGAPGVRRVHHPGLPDHPDHATARRLFPEGMFGAMVSVELEGGRERALAFMNALELTVPATSLGDVHTMALYPPMSSHRTLAPKHRQRLGITDGLVRLSVGIEAIEDILADLQQALAASAKLTAAPA